MGAPFCSHVRVDRYMAGRVDYLGTKMLMYIVYN